MSTVYHIAHERLLAVMTAARQCRPLREALSGRPEALQELTLPQQGVAGLAMRLMNKPSGLPPQELWSDFVSPTFLRLLDMPTDCEDEPLEDDFDSALDQAHSLEPNARARMVGRLVAALPEPTPQRVSALLKLALSLEPVQLRSRALSDMAGLYLSRGDREGALQCLELALVAPWGEELENPSRLREVEAALLMQQGQAFEASATLLQPVMAQQRGGLGPEGIDLLRDILREVDSSTFGSLRPAPCRPSLGGPMANATARATLAWALEQDEAFWQRPRILSSLLGLLDFLEPAEVEEARAALLLHPESTAAREPEKQVHELLDRVRQQVAESQDPVTAVLESLAATGDDEALTRAVIQWLRLALIKMARHPEAEELAGLAQAYL